MEPMHDATAKPADFVPDPAEQKKLEELFQGSQPTLTEEKVPEPKPARLSQLDKLRIENTSLKLMNIGQQLEKLLMDRARFSREFDELRQECFKTYGVDIALTRIDEEGNFCGPLIQQPVARKA